MNYTIIGDPHITPKNLDIAEVLFKLVEELNMPTIWMGDMLDSKEIIRGKCFNFVYNRLKQSKIQHIILVGNHDWFNLECQDHSLRVLNELPNVTVVDQLVIIDNMACIPYIHDKTLFKKELKKIGADVKTIFMHQDVKSFDYGNGFISEDGISLTSLKRFQKVISGHFHKHQENNNLTYIGTPFTHTFGESNQTKYIGIYNSDLCCLELIETKFKKHITETIDCNITNELPTIDPKNYNRVILIGTQENINKFNKTQFSDLNIKCIEKPTDSMMTTQTVDEAVDNVTQFKKWATDIKKIDKKTIKLGIQILESLNDK